MRAGLKAEASKGDVTPALKGEVKSLLRECRNALSVVVPRNKSVPAIRINLIAGIFAFKKS
jgi:hypothetical protein